MKVLKSCLLILLLLLLAAALLWRWWDREPTAEAPPETPPEQVARPAEPSALVVVRKTGPRPAKTARAADLATARTFLSNGGQLPSCGPYGLLTDVEDSQLIAACQRLTDRLDETYEQRYGVRPIGQPAETILLFSRLQDFRAFNASGAVGSAKRGYAGHAIPSRGLVVLHAETGSRLATLRTLLHELTHLLNRRAVGTELPRWLAEGLADGIGDTATADGLLPLTAVRGSEGEACRLQLGYRSGQAEAVSRLLTLASTSFDRGVVSFDYEQSAFLVRFLLAEPALAPPFRRLLRTLASGTPYSELELPAELGVASQTLDQRFEDWILGHRLACTT